jgi:hypothetical protein
MPDNSDGEDSYGHSRVPSAPETVEKIRKIKMERLADPSYSPNLSLCNFGFFERAKTPLRNPRFVDSDNVVKALTNPFGSVPFDELHRLFQSWIRQLELVIRRSGEYFTE